MKEATKESVDIKLDQVADEPKGEAEETRREREAVSNAGDPSGFASTAELVEYEIYDIKGRIYEVPNQPAGVFAAISREANGFIEVIMKSFDANQVAAIEVLQNGAESFGAKGNVADQVEAEAMKMITKKTIPRVIELLAKDAPEFLAKVVAMILEPEPDKIRRKRTLTYSVDDILWLVPVDQQVKAVSLYIDSLNLGALKKKVRSFREA